MIWTFRLTFIVYGRCTWRRGVLRGRGLLQPLQKKFLTFWATLPDQSQFYLTGGTALAEFYHQV